MGISPGQLVASWDGLVTYILSEAKINKALITLIYYLIHDASINTEAHH